MPTSTDNITCNRHGGIWGDDETCQDCTDVHGNARPQTAVTHRTLNLTIAGDEDEADTKVAAIISAIADSDALPTGSTATTEPKIIDPEWLDDIGDMLQADHVDVSWRARDARGRILFNSDISITPTQAAGMFRGIGEAQ